MFNLATKVRSNCLGSELKRGDEVRAADGTWYEITAEPTIHESYENGEPCVMAVPVASVKGRVRDTLMLNAAATVLIRRAP